MDTFKEIVSFLGAVMGLITALIPFCAYLADRRRRSRTAPEPAAEIPSSVSAPQPRATTARDQVEEIHPPLPDPDAFERARLIVRRPACVLLAVGCLELAFNLFMAGFAFIDVFITPLGMRTADNYALTSPRETAFEGSGYARDRADSDRNSLVLGIVMLFGFALASGVSIWSAYNMLNLRSYWLAVAGSVAVMPASCMCCLFGVPAGIWSLVVLLRPEVSSAFR